MNITIKPEWEQKFRHMQQSAYRNVGVKKIHKKLNEEFNLGDDGDLKNLIIKIFISVCFQSNESCPTIAHALKQLAHYAKIFIDVNGLKAVNDWAGHAKGDILLRRIVKCLMHDDAIIRFIKYHNIHFPKKNEVGNFDFVPYEDMRKIDVENFFFQIFREGGDEFSMVIYCPDCSLNAIAAYDGCGKVPLGDNSRKLSIIVMFRELIMNRVSMINIDDLVDKKCVMKKIDKFGLRLYNATEGRFQFFASVAGGETSFDNVMAEYIDNHDVCSIIYDRDFFGETLMGAVQNYVDELTADRKFYYKKRLSCGDACEQFEGYLITRSEEARHWFAVAKEIQCLIDKEMKHFSRSHGDMLLQIKQSMIESGLSEKQARKLIISAKNSLEFFAQALPEMLNKAVRDDC